MKTRHRRRNRPDGYLVLSEPPLPALADENAYHNVVLAIHFWHDVEDLHELWLEESANVHTSPEGCPPTAHSLRHVSNNNAIIP